MRFSQGVPVHRVPIVHERGDLEVNGKDTAIVSWSVLSQRNPHVSKAEMTARLKTALGLKSVVFIEGFDPLDGTRGHVDGMARFVAEDTVLVGNDGSQLMDSVAAQIAAQRPDFTIKRLHARSAAKFMNFLVGNGFVLVADSGHSAQNTLAQDTLQPFFHGREFHFVAIKELWY
jgi:agmatine deiminase